MSGAAAVAARRRAAAAAVWREFVRTRSGLVGLVLLCAVILIAVLAPVLVPAETLDVIKITAPSNHPPMAGYPLGTDPQGRSVLGMLIWGARISLLVGFAATAVSMIIGTVAGMAAGHFTGWVRAVIMRIIDFFLVIPGLVLAIVLSSVLSRGVWTIIIAIGVTSWAGTARVVRAQTLTIEGSRSRRRPSGQPDRTSNAPKHSAPATATSSASTCCPRCCRWCWPTPRSPSVLR